MRATLTLNGGSSSLKFSLVRGDMRLLRGQLSDLDGHPELRIEPVNGAPRLERFATKLDLDAALDIVLGRLTFDIGSAKPDRIVHRVVHGGPRHDGPRWVTPELLAELAELVPLAPLHQPWNLKLIDRAQALLPQARNVAVFDTAFHRRWDPRHLWLPVPQGWRDLGIQRYGFHGLSCQYSAERLRARDPDAKRAVVLHLGSGVSGCALKAFESIDSTLSFSALGGLPMATRCGDLDPAVVLHLWRLGRSLEEVETALYKQSGLLGWSGISGHMGRLQASEEQVAEDTISVWCERVAQAVAALATTLGGLDALVFTGGIGENAPTVRDRISARLGWLGVEIDRTANHSARGECALHGPASRVRLYRIPADEESVMERAARDLAE